MTTMSSIRVKPRSSRTVDLFAFRFLIVFFNVPPFQCTTFFDIYPAGIERKISVSSDERFSAQQEWIFLFQNINTEKNIYRKNSANAMQIIWGIGSRLSHKKGLTFQFNTMTVSPK